VSEHNPYAPPRADVRDSAPEPETGGLASRVLRLVGSIVDGILGLIVVAPLAYFTGYWQGAMIGEVDYVTGYAIAVASFAAFAAMNGYLLANHGQTIGKRVVGIRIVNVVDERVPKLVTLLGARYGLVWFVSLIPVVGGLFSLVDILLIFRADRRCVHDHIAGTKVVLA